MQGGEKGSALQAAAYLGDLKVVKVLVDKGANVNANGGRYGNALQIAASEGSLRIVSFLLEKAQISTYKEEKTTVPWRRLLVQADST